MLTNVFMAVMKLNFHSKMNHVDSHPKLAVLGHFQQLWTVVEQMFQIPKTKLGKENDFYFRWLENSVIEIGICHRRFLLCNINSVFSFSNTLEVTERTAALVLFPDPAIDFTCDFSSVVSGISANHQIAADKITTEGSNGIGSFQYELDFMVRTPQGTRFMIFQIL